MTDMMTIKFLACLIIAVLSIGVHGLLRGRKSEVVWLRSLVIGVWSGRLLLAVILYTAFPALVRFSDAVQFYYPETLALLDGGLPYRDFMTHYSPLFHPLMAVGVWLWASPGAIVLIMLIAEAALLINLVYFGHRIGRELDGWRCAWLTVSSPVMVYWVGVGGYNNVLIASFAMAGILSLARGHALRAGWAGAFSLLACKLLGVLTWPTLVIFGRGSLLRRLLPLILAVLLMVLLMVMGFDTLMPLKAEHDNWSGGNLWFLAAVVAPGIYNTVAVNILSPLLLAVAMVIGTLHILRRGRAAALAPEHMAWVLLAFMLLSRKTMGMYMPMLLPFAAYGLLQSGRLRDLWPLVVLGALTTIEAQPPWLDTMIPSRHFTTTVGGLIVLIADLIRVSALLWIGRVLWLLDGQRPVQQKHDHNVA